MPDSDIDSDLLKFRTREDGLRETMTERETDTAKQRQRRNKGKVE